MTLERLIAGATVLVAGEPIAWWLLAELPLPDPGPATTKAGVVVRLRADVAEIGEFASFNVNDENPFIPVHQRAEEKANIKPRPGVIPKPQATVIEAKAKPLPRTGAGAGAAPACLGLATTARSESVILRFPGESQDRIVGVGASVNGWTVTGIEHGNVVLLRDPGGVIQRVLIGR